MNDSVPDLDEVMRGRRNEHLSHDRLVRTRSQERLAESVRTKLNTAFIGAISQVEKHLGHLWGHGKKEHDCTPQELEFRRIWGLCRTDILNNGNNQIRAMKSEVKQYDVLWNRHHMDLEVTDEGSDS